ncbi:PREDICTED: protein STIG1-like [Lupinus angustifolius]|uniref:protein STIG1-like n=1 Tax=Lupinus angustifolius TaxID=3871 RepID=UPI00092FCC29|nr:PREDICTED: protein STIG1-like [Lupinus angustifolius]
MALKAQHLAFVTLLLLLVLVMIKIEGKLVVYDDANNVSSMLAEDCRNRAFACNQGEFPPRFLCCRNHCVDVTSDRTNCGLCGIRCRFNYKCCNRLCINININPFNCGRCGRVCPFGRLCLFGLCGFEQPSPSPSPSPSPPRSPPPPLAQPPTSMRDKNESHALNHPYFKETHAME